ncbi:MAG: GIY-YIG nuclease family protein [Bacillota bacterium]
MNDLIASNKMTSMLIAKVTPGDIPFITSDDKQKGLIYILDAGDSIKIGRTRNLQQRLPVIIRTSGKHIERIAVSPFCNNYCHIEAYLHRHFSSKRVIGEWFSVRFDDAVSELSKCEFDFTVKLPKENKVLKLFEMIIQM